jgi:hypothetical protein
MTSTSNYEKYPVLSIDGHARHCFKGWREVLDRIEQEIAAGEYQTIAIECYPGGSLDAFADLIRERFSSALVLNAAAAYKSSSELEEQFREKLTDDPHVSMDSCGFLRS